MENGLLLSEKINHAKFQPQNKEIRNKHQFPTGLF